MPSSECVQSALLLQNSWLTIFADSAGSLSVACARCDVVARLYAVDTEDEAADSVSTTSVKLGED